VDEFLKQNLEKLIILKATLALETDRGCALMTAAFLESEIESLIKEKLLGTNKEVEKLFEFNGPLGTFSSKAKLSYALGLISKSIFQDLEIIRNIRNDFAHNYKFIDFSTTSIKEKISKLKSHLNVMTIETVRELFEITALAILSEIHAGIKLATKFKEKSNLQLSTIEKEALNQQTISIAKEIVAKLGKEGHITLTTENVQLIAYKLASADKLK
jgi:DNA-binding MltR family transcriptional regulator